MKQDAQKYEAMFDFVFVLVFSLHFFKCGSKGAWYFPCKSHFNLLKREVITLFLFAIFLWWMLLSPLSPPGYNLSLKPKLENSKDELLKKVWIFTLHVLLIRKENRTMCNEKNHRDVYVTANMPPIEDIVIWTANPRQKSLKHLCTSLFLCKCWDVIAKLFGYNSMEGENERE